MNEEDGHAASEEEELAQHSPTGEATVVSREVRLRYSGPLPPPEALARYEETLPGAADRILAMSESQLSHNHEVERTVLRDDNRRAALGLIAGFVLAVLGFILVGFLAVNGQPWVAGLVAALDIGGLVGAFVVGSQGRRQEREARLRLMSEPLQGRREG